MKTVLNLLFLPLIKVHDVWYEKINIIKKLFKLFLFSVLAFIWFLIWLFIVMLIFELVKINQRYSINIVTLIFFSFFGIYAFIKNNKKLNLLSIISFIFILLVAVNTFIISPSNVLGDSMSPAIRNKQNVLIYKMDRNYKRGDIIVFENPKNPDVNSISRIIALSEDKIIIKESKVYLNGKLLQEPYASVETNLWKDGFVKEGGEITVPKEQGFVMGDNRPKASDSRVWGTFNMNKIIGKVIYIY